MRFIEEGDGAESLVADGESNIPPRGAWFAPFLQDGHRVGVAIDSHGRQVATVVLMPGFTASELKQLLLDVLDVVDPPYPALTIVRDPSD